MGITDWLFGPKPDVPDPAATAGQQWTSDIKTSKANNWMNNPNIYGPNGSVVTKVDGYKTVMGPNGNKTRVPQYKQVTELSSAGQKQNKENNQNINMLQNKFQNSFGNAPQKPAWQTGYDSENLGFNFQTNADTQQFDPGQYNPAGLQTSYAPAGGFSEDRRRVEDAMMSRGGDLLSQNRSGEVARLAAMGLAPGSEKYGRVADQFERSGNDLAMQAILAGGQEQSRQLGEARNSAGFTNQAIGQGFDMNMAMNQAENARRTGDMAGYNSAMQAINAAKMAQTGMNADKAGFSNATRTGMNNETQGNRQALVNQLMQMMSGGRPQAPQAPGFQGSQMPGFDWQAAIQNQYTQQSNVYNQNVKGFTDLATAGLGMI